MSKGHCPHGEFELLDGCPQCIEDSLLAKRRTDGIRPEQDEMEDGLNAEGLTLAATTNIVKVQYYSETTGELSTREYTYYSTDRLNVGDIVIVPVRDTTGKAKVSAIDVPEAEITAFKDKVKTIPVGSVATVNLCDTCQKRKDYPICVAIDVDFGDGKGNDNIIRCANYVKGEAKPCSIPMNVLFQPEKEATDYGRMAEESTFLNEPAPAVGTMPAPAIRDVMVSVITQALHSPVIIRLRDETVAILAKAEATAIASTEDVSLATADLSLIANLKKAVEDKRKELVVPLQEYVKTINGEIKLISDPLNEADRVMRQKVLAYKAEQEAKRIEAENLARMERELAERKAKLEGTEAPPAQPATTIYRPPDLTRTEAGSSTVMKVAKWELIDKALVPEHYKIVDAAAITRAVKASKGMQAIPGIRIFFEDSLRVEASR